jgi:hypothetical protein
MTAKEDKIRIKEIAPWGQDKDTRLRVLVSRDLDLCRELINAMYHKSIADQMTEGFDDVQKLNGFVFSGATQHDYCLLMYLKDFNHGVIVHETIHVLFALERLVGVEITKEAEEWIARMGEQIFNSVIQKDTYKTFTRQDIESKRHLQHFRRAR